VLLTTGAASSESASGDNAAGSGVATGER
jgi:hypothetical protein